MAGEDKDCGSLEARRSTQIRRRKKQRVRWEEKNRDGAEITSDNEENSIRLAAFGK